MAETVTVVSPAQQTETQTDLHEGGETDHGLGTGLGDDDHAQYALLAGRAGGQTLKGGTAAGEDLVLQSTAHATKGAIRGEETIIMKRLLAGGCQG
jgi:hypothetical protein